MTFERTDKQVGDKPFKFVTNAIARLLVEKVATVGNDNMLLACIYLATESFVEKVKT